MPEAAKCELVVLIHGIGAHRALMWPLARRLDRQGYATRLYTYFTLWGSNEQCGRRFAAELRRLAATGRYARIHVVAHSMGSIVTRCALLQDDLPAQLGRIVMIGPPNRGSHVARQLKPVYGWFSSTLMELVDTPESFVNQLPGVPDHVEVGVLATRRDRVIELANTHLDGQRDHRTIEGMHTAALWTQECAVQTAHFLQNGAFLHEEPLAAVNT